MSTQLQRNKAASLHLIPRQIRQGTFCHEPRSRTHIREILPSDCLGKNSRMYANTGSLLLISPMALWHFGELEMTDSFFFPEQTAESELSNGPTENINRYHSRIILGFCPPPHNPGAGRKKFSVNIINFMMRL